MPASIGKLPVSTFFNGDMPDIITPAVGVDFPSDITWDTGTTILWDDSTVIQWSNTLDINPDAAFQFSSPVTVFTGEAE